MHAINTRRKKLVTFCARCRFKIKIYVSYTNTHSLSWELAAWDFAEQAISNKKAENSFVQWNEKLKFMFHKPTWALKIVGNEFWIEN